MLLMMTEGPSIVYQQSGSNVPLGDPEDLINLTNSLIDRDAVLEREHRKLKTFNKIIIDSNEGDNQQQLTNNLLKSVMKLFNFDVGAIYLVSHTTQIPSRYISINYPESDLLDSACVTSQEFIHGKPIYHEHYNEVHPDKSKIMGDVHTFVRIPIIYDNKVEGCINLGTCKHTKLDNYDCSMLKTIGKHLGHVIYRINIEIALNTRVIETEATNQELNASLEELREYVAKVETKTYELDRERANFKKLFDKIPDMVIVTDLNGIIININDSVLNHLGYARNEIIGKYVGSIHDKQSNSDILDIIEVLNTDPSKNLKVKLTLCNKVTKNLIPIITYLSTGFWDGKFSIFGMCKVIEEHPCIDPVCINHLYNNIFEVDEQSDNSVRSNDAI